ncbi:uncharacterized protein [Haliotis cracherodii]|uniref:uncharacterized protein n=1 Tax=Haliotis cracherodii TaxID=6455 RepID=UPI0039EB99FF
MGVTIETWRARIGLHSQPNKSPRTTTTQGMVTGGGSFPCRPRHVLLVIGLLLLLSGNVEVNPGPSSRRQQPPQQNTSSNKLYTNKDESFTTTEVLEILQNPDLSRVINQPPVKPRAGQAFLYHFTDANKRDDWRCDQYHFHHDATREQPKADPKFKKLFFVIKTRVGKDKRFKKHAYILLGEDNNLVLFQYIGNERIAEDLPHGNSKNTSVPYTRLCPSVIRAIKDVSSNYTETLRCLNQQTFSSTVPEVYKPRSRLHVMNTRYRGQRDCTKEARTNRLGITGDKTACNLTAFLTKDIEVGKVVPWKGKRKQPKRLKNLQQISCKQIVRAPLGCLPYDERAPGSQDDLEPQEGTRNKNTTPQTPLGFDLVHSNDDLSAADNDNKPSLESETSQASKHCHLTSDQSNAIQMASRDNTDLGASEAVDFLKIILEDQCITSKNSITVDALSQHFEENNLTHSLSEDGDFQVSCQGNNQSNSDIAERNSGDTTLSQTTPYPEIENVNNEETQLAPLEKFIHDIFNNGQLSQMIKLLQHLHSTWNVRQPQHKAAEDQAVESVASADEQTCFNDNGLQPRMLSTFLPFTASTLITQVRSLWISDFKTTSDCLLKTENICSIVQQNINSDTMLSLLTSLVVGAFNMQTDIVEFVETLKERPGHLEPPGNNIIADVSNHVRYRIGSNTVTGQDVMKLNKTSWLDDSVIHAYLSLLEERFSKEDKKVFIFECFLATFWEKKNYGVWLYKEVTLTEYTWILMPICRHSHWILLAANIREGSVCVINSKPSDVTQREILHQWSEYMAHRSRETRENLSDWREIQCPIFPQTDGSSCGVFILMAAEALLSGVSPCVMRNCHVTGYREYVKQQIVNAAEMQAGGIEESNVQSSDEVEIIESSSSTNQNTTKLHAETENRRKSISTGTSVFDSQQESVICEELVDGISDMKMEPSSVKKQERLDTSGGMTGDTNFIVGDSIHTIGSMEIEATSEITPSDLHDTTTGACPADLRSYCEELFQNQKSSFVALTLVCLMKGHLQLTTLECQENSSHLKDYIKWGCQLCNCGETSNTQIRNAFLGLEKFVLISNMNTRVTLRSSEVQKTISTVIADHLQEYIDIIDLKFIYHYLRIHTQDGGFHVWLKGKMVEDLARRFAKEVLQNNLALVLSHDSCGYFHFNVMLRKAVQHLLKSEDFHSILENTDKTFGGTFIHWMCFSRNAELFKSLSFWLTDSQKTGCLVPCCISGNSSIVQLLCSETELTECQKIPKLPQLLPGITHEMEKNLTIIESYDTHALPPLHLSSLYGHTGVVSYLLDSGFDVNEQLVDRSGNSIPFQAGSTSALVAATMGNIDIVKCLIQHSADLNLHDIMFNAPIHSACRSGNNDLVALISRQCCISEGDAEGDTPLHIACERGDIDIVSMLLERGADCTLLNYKNEMPLDIVCKKGFLEVAQVILNHSGYSLPYDGSNTPLHKACIGGFTDIIELLLEYGADRSVTVDDQHPLLIAAYSNNIDVVQMLLHMNAARVVLCDTHIAVTCLREGHNVMVKLLLEKGASLSGSDIDGYSALASACERGDIEIVKLLLEKGASLSGSERYGYSPLASACERGDIEIVKLLLEKGASVSGSDRYGYSPLASACERGDIEIVKLLLEKGASVSGSDIDGYSALASACRSGDIEIVKLLLEKGASVSGSDRYGYSPLASACERGDIEIVKLLLEKGTSVSGSDRYGYSPLASACERGDIEIVKLLLEKGASVSGSDRYGYSPLASACERGDIEIVKLLLEKGASLSGSDIDGYSALASACERGDIEIVKLLLEKGASVSSSYGYSALDSACERGDIEIVKLLLEKGASVSGTDRCGCSALASACRRGDIEIVKLLLEKGASVSGTDKDGYLPLAIACDGGDIEIVKLLLEKGAGVSGTDRYGYLLLAIACGGGDIEIVKLLLEKGASVSGTDRYRCLAKASACRRGDIEIVKLLLEKGDVYSLLARACEKGDIAIVNRLLEKGDVYSLLAMACEKGDIAIVKLLLEKGAREPSVYCNFRLLIKRLQNLASIIDIQSLLKWVLTNKYFAIFRMLLTILPQDAIIEFFLHEACHQNSPQTLLLLTEICDEICLQNTLTTTESLKNIKCIEILKLLNTEVAGGDLLHIVVACGNINLVRSYFENFPFRDHADVCVIIASRYGHTAIVEYLLHKCNNNITSNTYSGRCNVQNTRRFFHDLSTSIVTKYREVRTALYEACCQGHTDIVRLLLQYDMYRTDQAVSSSLHLVCRRGNIDMLQLLLDSEAYVDHVDQNGNTGLYICTENGRVLAMQLLLEKGANPSHANNEGKAPFHAAIENNNFNAVVLLLRYTTKLSNVPVSKLNNCELFKFVSDHIPPPTLTSADPDGNSLLHYAVRYGFPDSVATLLERGVDGSLANCKKETAMHIAAERGCQRSVRLLIQYHYTTDVENVDKQTPLHCAASEGHLNIVKDLIECNSNISLKGCLHYAARSGHTETVQHLLNKGAVTNESDCQSYTPLHLACESGNINTVEVLLSSSADVNAVGHKGRTPLHIACARGYDRIVDCLLDRNADPNIKNKFNNTPLLSAVVEGHLEVIKLMVLKGAKSQIAGANGSNYLIACCTRGHKDVVRYLIENGADISSKDIQCITPLSVSLSDIDEEERENIDYILKTGRSGIEGMTSLHAAMDGNHFELAEYLINQGADVLDDDQYGKSILLKVCEKGNSKVTKAFLSSESVFPSMLRKDIIEGFSMKNIQASHHSEKNSKDSLSVREIGNDVLEVIDEPDTDFVPVPPIKAACDCGHDDVASVLIAYSAEWLSDLDDSHLYNSKSPVHLAYDAGFMDIVACLLSSSTNSNAIDSHGYTIFHKACEHGDVKVFKNILKLKRKHRNPEFCIKTKYGEMLCHIASRKGYMHILKMCLKVGMDLTHVTEEGDNALHLACSYDKHRVCAFLLDTSPSLAWIKNHNGFTPLDIVMRRGNNKIARIFFAHAKLTRYGRMQDVIWMYLRESMDNINRLNLLVRCSNVMDLTDDHGNTPFHVTSMVGSNRATDYLLKHDKKDCVRQINSNGDTPLHIASEQGHSAVVRSLLTQCHVNAINNYNETALHLSSLYAHLDTVVALLGAGACVDSRNFQGDSPLHLLLYGCTNKPNNDFTHIITILRHCLASGIDPCQNDLGNTPLHVACCTGKIVIVGELLSGYKDLCMRNTFGKTPLHVACERGQSVIVDLLLEVMWLRKSFGEEFNDFMNHQDAVNRSTPLHLASRCNGQAALLLVEHGANTTIKDNDGNTPICVAYLTGQKENVKHLLPHTPYLDINGSGDTLLHAACRSDQTDMFQIIIDWLGSVGPKIAGNTVNASNCTRQTSLHLASANGKSYFVEQLLLMGAMPNNPDTSRKTALHYACIGRFVLVVAHLLKHGAHVNVCDDFIRTSLHYACESGSMVIAEILTKAGGDPYIRDKDGRTPLDLCSHQHRAIIMKSLRYKRKRQATCSGDPPSSKRPRCEDTHRRGRTFEDTETCQHTRSVSYFRRSLSVGESPRRVSSDDLCLQKE